MKWNMCFMKKKRTRNFINHIYNERSTSTKFLNVGFFPLYSNACVYERLSVGCIPKNYPPKRSATLFYEAHSVLRNLQLLLKNWDDQGWGSTSVPCHPITTEASLLAWTGFWNRWYSGSHIIKILWITSLHQTSLKLHTIWKHKACTFC